MTKIISWELNLEYYQKKDKKLLDENRLIERVSLWNSAKIRLKDPIVYKYLAEAYFDLNLNDLSVDAWYRYLNKITDKNEMADCYYGLGNNYFTLGNTIIADYYYNMVFISDGPLDAEKLLPEAVEYFSAKADKKDEYKIVHSINKDDSEDVMMQAKLAVIDGDMELACELYESVPINSKLYSKARVELAIASVVTGETEKAINYCYQAVKADEKNVFALSTLASLFCSVKDFENSYRYYEKALKLDIDREEDLRNILVLAGEHKEHEVVLSIAKRLLEINPYDPYYLFVKGIACFNLGYLKIARESLLSALMIKGYDTVYEYYIKVVDMAIDRGLDGKRNDAEYYEQLPLTEVELNRKILRDIVELSSRELNAKLKKDEVNLAIKWATKYGNNDDKKLAVYILASSRQKWAEKVLFDLLLDMSTGEYIKRVILTVLVINGINRKVGIVSGNIYAKTKINALNEDVSTDFLYAYAGAVSIIAPLSIGDTLKAKKATEFLYKALPFEVVSELDGTELSALICYASKYDDLSRERVVCEMFGVKRERFKEIITLCGGYFKEIL